MFGIGKKGKAYRFEYGSKHQLAEQHELLDRYIKDVSNCKETGYYADIPLKKTETGTEISKMPAETICDVVMAAHERLEHSEKPYRKQQRENRGNTGHNDIYLPRHILFFLVRVLMRRKLPYSREQIDVLMTWFDSALAAQNFSTYTFPASGIVKTLKDFADRGEDIDTMVPLAKQIIAKAEQHPAREVQALADKMQEILGIAPDLPIRPGEAWGDAAIEYIGNGKQEAKAGWVAMLAHCQKVSGGKPKVKWSKTAKELADAITIDAFVAAVPDWFLLVDKPRTQVIDKWSEWVPNPNLMIDDNNADVIKGLVWVCGLVGDDRLADSIGKLAMSAYRKVPGVGPRATKIGNACVWALGQIPGESSLAALAILKVRVKYRPAQKGIQSALAEAAERAGMTPQELEEIGVPAYGMEEVGVRRETIGEHEAILRVLSAKKTELTWQNEAGKILKTVPKAVRENHAEDLKDLRQAGKDILKMLSAQRERLDNLFLDLRSWKYADWLQRYVEHPLVGTLGRRLIWNFEIDGKSRSGMWFEGKVVDAEGAELKSIDKSAVVRLWHPVGEDTETIVGWRAWVEHKEITQPFKQAHREIYLLTAAEEATEVYSNRYASHIVKQHQFNALCAARGWRHSLRLMVDDEYGPPTKMLPQWDLRVEFWVEGVGDDYGTDTTEAGSYLYLATDQVRFYRTDAAQNSAHAGGGGYRMYGGDNDHNEPLPLLDIDPLALSEVMRDVDLFVGVASVGNDPNWSDGGPEGRFVDYWTNYSFGELNASAETRKTILQNLLPKLKIGDRCEIVDRFLRVKGDIKTYKIHLGSGNVLMEPADQYLCIVTAQGMGARLSSIFLPFEGDNRLAVILSKAFLLAEDKKIKDKTILSQIGH